MKKQIKSFLIYQILGAFEMQAMRKKEGKKTEKAQHIVFPVAWTRNPPPPQPGSNTKIAKFDGNNTHCYSDTET